MTKISKLQIDKIASKIITLPKIIIIPPSITIQAFSQHWYCKVVLFEDLTMKYINLFLVHWKKINFLIWKEIYSFRSGKKYIFVSRTSLWGSTMATTMWSGMTTSHHHHQHWILQIKKKSVNIKMRKRFRITMCSSWVYDVYTANTNYERK